MANKHPILQALINGAKKTSVLNRGHYPKTAATNTRYIDGTPLEEPIAPSTPEEPGEDDDPAKRLVEEESYLALSRRIHDVLSPFENQIWWPYLSGRTAGEIAKQVGSNEKAVQNAIYRIRKKLRAVIPYS